MPEPSAVGLLPCRRCGTFAWRCRSQPRVCRVCSGCSPGKPGQSWSCQRRGFGAKAALGGTAGAGRAVETEKPASGSCSAPCTARGHGPGDALPSPPTPVQFNLLPLETHPSRSSETAERGQRRGESVACLGAAAGARPRKWGTDADLGPRRTAAAIEGCKSAGAVSGGRPRAAMLHTAARMSNKALIILFFQLVVEQQPTTKICKSAETLQRGRKEVLASWRTSRCCQAHLYLPTLRRQDLT